MRLSTGFLLACLTAPLFSQTPSAEGPLKVKVSTYIVSLGKFDLATGSYTVDFYITLDTEKGDLSKLDLEFVNGRGSFDKVEATPTKISYRVLANLYTNIDLHRYPFDSHKLSIQLEDKRKSLTELQFVPVDSESGVDPEIVLIGWDMRGWKQYGREHSYPGNELYHQYVFEINLHRVGLTSAMKLYIPILCFIIVTFISLIISPEKIDNRIGINTAMLIASVMFHVAMLSSLPPLAYLTLGDRIMIATYMTVGLNLLQSVRMLYYVLKKEPEKVDKIFRHSRILVPAFCAAAYSLAIVTTFA